MKLLFLERVFTLLRNSVMRGVDLSLFCWLGCKTEYRDDKFGGFVISLFYGYVNSYDFCIIDWGFIWRHFSNFWFWKIAAQPTFIPCILSVQIWWWSGKLFWMLKNFSSKVMRSVLILDNLVNSSFYYWLIYSTWCCFEEDGIIYYFGVDFDLIEMVWDS